MDFRLTEEQMLIQESMREFCKRYIKNEDVVEWGKQHRVPDSIYKAYLDEGFARLNMPEEYGGTEIDTLTACLLNEEMFRNVAASMPFSGNAIIMRDILEMGTPEQIKIFYDNFEKTGVVRAALCISEPCAGSDNKAMITTTKSIGNGKYILNGSKTFCTNAEYADYLLVIAKDESPERSNPNYTMWLVYKHQPGIKTSRLEKISACTAPFCEVYFDDVELTDNDILGKKGEGFKNLMKNFETERITGCANMLGGAQAAMDDAAAYAASRITFGKTLGEHQLIQEKLVNMEVKIQNMRNLIYKTAWEKDNGISVRTSAALCKYYCANAATEVCSDALQIFGGLGYTNETRVGRLWLEMRGTQIAAGTNEMMIHIAGRQLVKQYAK